MLESVRKKYGADIVRRGAGRDGETQTRAGIPDTNP